MQSADGSVGEMLEYHDVCGHTLHSCHMMTPPRPAVGGRSGEERWRQAVDCGGSAKWGGEMAAGSRLRWECGVGRRGDR